MFRRFGFLACCAMALALSGCGGGGGGDSGTSGGPPPAPTVSLSLSNASVRAGSSVILTWSSTSTTSCTATGAWTGAQQTSGTQSITPTQTGPSTYQLNCTGAGGSTSASATLTVAAPLTQVTVPGLPAPVPVASGECVPYSDANMTITCITTAGAVPAKYDNFSSANSASVTLSGNNTPTVQTGGSCTGGFSTSSSQFAVDTTLGNDTIAFTGATVAEVVFSSAFLTSLGVQSTITSLSALVISDNSNTDHFQVVMYANGPSGPFTLATGGTVSQSGTSLNINVLECLGTATTSPPPPPPTSLNCPNGGGSGQNGISFGPGQSLRYNISTTGASQSSTDTLTWGAAYNNPQLTSTSYTGSLRLSFYAVPYSFQGSGQINGYLVAHAFPSFTGSGAKSANQLYNFSSATNISSVVTGSNPPTGQYCMVMSLDVYNTDTTSCTDSDHFCYVDWVQFPGAQAFN